MLRKELFGGNSTHDQSDRLNKILSGTEITGDIVSDANLLIEGEIIGNVSCSGKVFVGTSGKIKGNLVCVNAEIDGAMAFNRTDKWGHSNLKTEHRRGCIF